MTLLDRVWSTDNAGALQSQLQQLVSDLQGELGTLAALTMQMQFDEGVISRGTGQLTIGRVVIFEVETDVTATALLPRPSPQDAGKFCGLLRRRDTGSIKIIPTTKVDASTSLTITTGIGLYLFFCDGANFWTPGSY